MPVWMPCVSCGCLVADVDAHVAWHQQIASLAPAIPAAPDLTHVEDDPPAAGTPGLASCKPTTGGTRGN